MVKLLVDLGEDVNHADSYGITPLMAAANLGDINIVRYLIDTGADLNAHDLGKKNDGAFGSSVEPLMPIDYAIGVGTFVPNNAVIMHADVVKLMSDEMKTSECTLRDSPAASPMWIPRQLHRLRSPKSGRSKPGIR